jgi:hypothetical protein
VADRHHLALARNWWEEVKAGFSRHWISLPNTEKYSDPQ